MNAVFFGIFIRSMFIGAAIALAVFVLSRAALGIARARVKSLSEHTRTSLDDLLSNLLSSTRNYFLLAVSIYVASFSVAFAPETRVTLNRCLFLVGLIQASVWGSTTIAFWLDRHLRKRSMSDPSSATSLGLIGFLAKFVLFALVVLLALHNFGFNITTLIAGLGVGGIAVALAVQNILGDLFASLTIVLDKPFVVGDFIAVGEFMGTIEHIGLKTTRVRSLTGEQLIFANSDLLRSRVRNYKRMTERRVSFMLGVVYQTSPAKLRKVPELIKKIVVSADPQNLRFERCHFLRLGPSSLDFEIVYWVNSADFDLHADLAQKINLEIVRTFASEGIDFAYPSQTLYLRQEQPLGVELPSEDLLGQRRLA